MTLTLERLFGMFATIHSNDDCLVSFNFVCHDDFSFRKQINLFGLANETQFYSE